MTKTTLSNTEEKPKAKVDKVEAGINKFAAGKQFIKDNLWYGLIGLLTIIVLVIFPLIGSGLPLALVFPTTAIGWVVYIFTKLSVAAINMCIFHSFMEQGKLNVSGFWKKCIADEILHRVKQKKVAVPLSPEEWTAREYKTKGISLGITSILSCVILSQVVLAFDVIVFISYLLALAIGITFGIMQLFKAEHYWSLDYYDYAIYVMNNYNATVPEEQQLSVRNKSLYEGENIIYEYN